MQAMERKFSRIQSVADVAFSTYGLIHCILGLRFSLVSQPGEKRR